MNKKVKLLSSVLCSAVLASNLAAVSVQAKEPSTDASKKSQNSILMRGATDEDYSSFTTYCTISHNDVIKILDYYKNPQGQTINEFLVKNKITDSSHANLIAYALDKFYNSGILETQDKGNGVKFLQPEGAGILVRMTIAPNNDSATRYGKYCRLTAFNGYDINTYLNQNPNADSYQLASFLIQKGMVTDRSIANNVASLILENGRVYLYKLNNNGVYILQSNTDPSVRVITPIQV